MIGARGGLMAIAMLSVASTGVSAHPRDARVKLVEAQGDKLLIQSTATASKSKDAQEEAVKGAFWHLLHSGLEGVHDGQPMVVGESSGFDYRLMQSQYPKYLERDPSKAKDEKVSGQHKVVMLVEIDAKGLASTVEPGGAMLSPAWKSGAGVKKSDSPLARMKPTIVIVPRHSDYAADFGEMAELLSQDPVMRSAVTAVGAKFADHGYKTQDMVTMLQNSTVSDVMSRGAQKDLETLVVRHLPGDIVVTVDVDADSSSKGTCCTVNLKAVERQTGNQLAARGFVSGYYDTSDQARLVSHAIDNMDEAFFRNVDNSFADMVRQGRPMVIEFQLADSVTDWDFDTEIPGGKVDFRDYISEWLRDHAMDSVYERSAATDKYIQATLNIPLWDTEQNRSYGMDNFASDLKRDLNKALRGEYGVKVTEMGQRLQVTIR